MRFVSAHFLKLCLSGTLLTALPYAAQAALVHGVIDDTQTITLSRDLSSGVAHAKDAGKVADTLALPHIRLELKRPAEKQAALDKLVIDQQTKGSPQYRHWLKPADLRAYGPDQADIAKVSAWLTSHNLTVNHVSPSGMMIDFGGSARDVASAFHTTLHNVNLHGEAHIANMTAPKLPAALASVVTGVTLHNFFPKPAYHPAAPAYTKSTSFGTFYAVTPSDFATIYNTNPLYNGTSAYHYPITGAGITIAVVEQTLILAHDWNLFRSTFGLSGYTSASLVFTHPGGCTNPHFIGDETEAAIDAEWASAVAPNATIEEASCQSEAPLNFGVEEALQNLVEDGTDATVFSISYGGTEVLNGFSFTAGWTNLVEEGAAEGISIMVSTGDSGASVDEDAIDADGVGVNALSDSYYVTAVGGTDFLDTYKGQNATYWKNKNSATGGSAISYVPETTWNNSCASPLIYKTAGASGASQYCNTAPTSGQPNVGGTGGPSLYYTKPSWQLTTIPGMPNDNARDQPDVSLLAANGIWGHFYLICMSDANEGGVPCNYKSQNDFFGSAYGGTSVAAPAFAGIVALEQETNALFTGQAAIGNPAPYLYSIANAQMNSTGGLAPCNSSLGNKISTACVFNIVTSGTNAGPCYAGSPDCKAMNNAADGIGITTNPKYAGPAYSTGLGYNLATGLGSVNALNLLYNFPNISN